jgi:hypothetical protein
MVTTNAGGQRYLRLTPFSAGSSGTSGARGTSGTSGARGTSGTSGTSAAGSFTPAYFQTYLSNDINYTANTDTLITFDVIEHNVGSVLATADTASIPPQESWELSAHVTCANWTNYSSLAFYDLTSGTYLKVSTGGIMDSDCPQTITIDMIFKSDAPADIQVIFRGTGTGTIVANSFAACNGDIVGGGGTTLTWYYGHRLA